MAVWGRRILKIFLNITIAAEHTGPSLLPHTLHQFRRLIIFPYVLGLLLTRL